MTRAHVLAVALLSATALAGCASKKYIPPEIQYDNAVPAVQKVDPLGPVKVVELPKPLPLPGQLKPVQTAKVKTEPADPKQRISQANEAARMQPVRDGFVNAIQL
ncbi:MAG: P-type conjugative transfer protein TrbG, partial [Mesorhizobium sp.]